MPLGKSSKLRLEALQQQQSLLSEKIMRLRKQFAIETDIADRFKLERQIEEVEKELDKVEQETDTVSKKSLGAPIIPIPSILPYLSDRSEQEEALKQALHEAQKNKPRRPIICIIHGHEAECYDKFLERLEKILPPGLLHQEVEPLPIKRYMLEWSSSSRARHNRRDKWRESLSFLLAENDSSKTDRLAEFISRHPTSVMIHTLLFTEDWPHTGCDWVEDFIGFWNDDLPNLAPGRFLFVCLCFKYQNLDRLGFVQRRKFKMLENAIRGYVDHLNFAAYNGVHGVTLPELCAIRRSDVEYWVHKFAGEYCDTHELLSKVSALYHTPDMRIPMNRLAETLNQFIADLRF